MWYPFSEIIANRTSKSKTDEYLKLLQYYEEFNNNIKEKSLGNEYASNILFNFLRNLSGKRMENSTFQKILNLLNIYFDDKAYINDVISHYEHNLNNNLSADDAIRNALFETKEKHEDMNIKIREGKLPYILDLLSKNIQTFVNRTNEYYNNRENNVNILENFLKESPADPYDERRFFESMQILSDNPEMPIRLNYNSDSQSISNYEQFKKYLNKQRLEKIAELENGWKTIEPNFNTIKSALIDFFKGDILSPISEINDNTIERMFSKPELYRHFKDDISRIYSDLYRYIDYKDSYGIPIASTKFYSIYPTIQDNFNDIFKKDINNDLINIRGKLSTITHLTPFYLATDDFKFIDVNKMMNYLIKRSDEDILNDDIEDIENYIANSKINEIYHTKVSNSNKNKIVMLENALNNKDYQNIPLKDFLPIFDEARLFRPSFYDTLKKELTPLIEYETINLLNAAKKYIDDERKSISRLEIVNNLLRKNPNTNMEVLIESIAENDLGIDELNKHIASLEVKPDLNDEEKSNLIESIKELKNLKKLKEEMIILNDKIKMNEDLKNDFYWSNSKTLRDYSNAIDIFEKTINNNTDERIDETRFKHYVIQEMDRLNSKQRERFTDNLMRVLNILDFTTFNTLPLKTFLLTEKMNYEKIPLENEEQEIIDEANKHLEEHIENGKLLNTDQIEAVLEAAEKAAQINHDRQIEIINKLLQNQNAKIEQLENDLIMSKTNIDDKKHKEILNEINDIRNNLTVNLNNNDAETLSRLSKRTLNIWSSLSDLGKRNDVNFTEIKKIKDDVKIDLNDLREELATYNYQQSELKQQLKEDNIKYVYDINRDTQNKISNMIKNINELNNERLRILQGNVNTTLGDIEQRIQQRLKEVEDKSDKIVKNISDVNNEIVKLNNKKQDNADIINTINQTQKSSWEMIKDVIQSKEKENKELYNQVDDNIKQIMSDINLGPSRFVTTKEERYKARFDNIFSNEEKVRAALLNTVLKINEEEELKQQYFKTKISQSKLKEALGFLPSDPDLTLAQVEKFLPEGFFADVQSSIQDKTISPIKLKTTNYTAVDNAINVSDSLKKKLLQLYFYYKDPKHRTEKSNEFPREFMYDLSILNLNGKPSDVIKRYIHYLRTGQ